MRRALVHAGLVRLALRRSAPLGLVALVVVLLALATARDGADSSLLPTFARATSDAGRARGLVWAVLLLVGAPVLVGRAAGIAERWRARDADWFAVLPVPRLAYATNATLGLLGVAVLGALLTAACAEGAARRSAEGAPLRWSASPEHPPALLAEGAAAWSWTPAGLRAEDLPPGARLVLAPTVAPGSGPALTVRASLGSEGAGRTELRERVYGRTRLELALPPDARGALDVALAREGPGAVLVLPPASIELLLPAGAPAWASGVLLGHALLALVAWAALAAGLGAWMRPGLALATALALALAPAVPDAPLLGLLPGADLARTWELVDAGLVPAPPGPAALLASGLVTAAGVLLLARGIASGRSLP
jgi:hypothetical protein